MERILIVEDSATQREMLHHMLAEQGYVVASAKDGQEALLKLAGAITDLVITDILMPRMDGYELCRAIKKRPTLHQIPVLLLTSLADSKDIIGGLQCGADGFIGKPYEEDDLLARVRQVLANRGLAVRDQPGDGVELIHDDKHYLIHAERRQILDLLLSVYDTAVRRNQDLIRTQQELKRLNDDLEQKVADRTRKLQTSNDSLETFCYSIAHDLRAPLRGIQGYVTMLGEDYAAKLDGTAREYISRATSAVQRMDVLLRDLLAYGRVSRSDAPMAWLDFAEEARKVLSDLGPDISRSGAVVRVEGDGVRLWGNRSLLAQVLQNLLSNAIKFVAPNMTPKIQLTAHALPDGGVRVHVTDNGIGIPAAFQRKIFNVFEKLHVDQAYPGSGIGLAIVKQAVERMGGSITVRSTEGEGSCFEVAFPDGASKEQAEPTVAEPRVS